MYSAHVGFQTHLRDVVTILQYLLHHGTPPLQLFARRNFALFVLRRVYAQIRAQVALAHNVWGDHPTTLLRHALASRTRRDQPAFTVTLRALADSAEAPFILDCLHRHGICPCESDHLDFAVTPENVYAWACVLDQVCEPLRNVVRDLPGSADVCITPTPPGKEGVEATYTSMEALRVLLDSSLIEAVCAYVPRGIGFEAHQRTLQERWKAALARSGQGGCLHAF